jgi:hypothetical protein
LNVIDGLSFEWINEMLLNVAYLKTYFNQMVVRESQIFSFFPFVVMLGGGTLWHLYRFLQGTIISHLNSPPPPFPFMPPSLIHGIVLTGMITAYTFIYIHFCTLSTIIVLAIDNYLLLKLLEWSTSFICNPQSLFSSQIQYLFWPFYFHQCFTYIHTHTHTHT